MVSFKDRGKCTQIKMSKPQNTDELIFFNNKTYQERIFSFKHSFTEKQCVFGEVRCLFGEERSINNGYLLPNKCQVLPRATTLIDDITKLINKNTGTFI